MNEETEKTHIDASDSEVKIKIGYRNSRNSKNRGESNFNADKAKTALSLLDDIETEFSWKVEDEFPDVEFIKVIGTSGDVKTDNFIIENCCESAGLNEYDLGFTHHVVLNDYQMLENKSWAAGKIENKCFDSELIELIKASCVNIGFVEDKNSGEILSIVCDTNTIDNILKIDNLMENKGALSKVYDINGVFFIISYITSIV